MTGAPGMLAPLLTGPLGIVGPMLPLLLELWFCRGDRAPRPVKAALLALLAALLLAMFGYL